MNDPRHRYLNDPTYHMVVDQLRTLIRDARLAPSEIREAAMLACVIEEMYRPAEPLTTSDEELQIMRVRMRPLTPDSVSAKTCTTTSRCTLPFSHGGPCQIED